MIFQFFSKVRNKTIVTDSLSKQDLKEIYADHMKSRNAKQSKIQEKTND